MLQTKCGVRQSWAACFFLVHWGCLRLGMLEPWLWWNGLRLHLEDLNLDYDLWVFAWNGLGLHLEGMHLMSFWPLMLIMCIHLWWAQVVGLEWFKKQFSVSIQSRVQSQAFGLEFIHSIQGSNNYDGSSIGLGLIMVQTMAKHMHNAMQLTWADLKVGFMGHCNMGKR